LNGVNGNLYQNVHRETRYHADGKTIYLNFTKMPSSEYEVVQSFKSFMDNQVLKYLKRKEGV